MCCNVQIATGDTVIYSKYPGLGCSDNRDGGNAHGAWLVCIYCDRVIDLRLGKVVSTRDQMTRRKRSDTAVHR